MPLKHWPGVCKKRSCACDLVFTDKCYRNCLVCFSCTLPVPHPLYKKLLTDEEEFNKRLNSYGILCLGSLFSDYFSMTKFVVRASDNFLGMAETSSDENE